MQNYEHGMLPWSTKPVISSTGIFCSNSQHYIVWVKIIEKNH